MAATFFDGSIFTRSVTGALSGAALAALAALPLGPAAAASEGPTRSVTMVVPFSAGGGSDVLARQIAGALNESGKLPKGLVVENRPGGSGAVGYSLLASHKGDPNWIATVSVSFFTTPLLGQSPVSYKDFTPLAAIAQDPYILVVKAGSDIKSVNDLKGKQGLVAATTGIVADPTILAKMLEKAVGASFKIVPYEGDGEVLSAILGGHVNLQFGNPSEILAQIKSGDLRALAVSSGTRLAALPDVPTFKELGYDIELVQLRGVVAPKGIPEGAVAFWENALKAVAESKAWKTNYLDRFNVQPLFMGSREFGDAMAGVSARYEALMREQGLIKK
jgi:putative tricarboxylic transport membrane protein